MRGKTCLVTGGNSGIGKVIALKLAEAGAKVIIACRNKEKGQIVRKEIIRKTGNKNISLLFGDFSSFKSVRKLAKDINILIKENNKFNGYLYNTFYPSGTKFPFYFYPFSTFAPIKPDKSIYGKSYLLPNEELEFQYGPLGYTKKRYAITLTLFCSYFDSDNNEYLSITKQIPGSESMDIIFNDNNKLCDSLSKLSKGELYKYIIYNSINLREIGRPITSSYFDSLLTENDLK